jgi:methyl-accepting chemotaxis protein
VVGKRKIRNLLINKNLQLRITLKFLVAAVCFSVVNGITVFFTLWTAIVQWVPEAEEIEQYFRVTILYILALNSVAIIALITGLGIIFTHRIAGPIHRIQQQLERMLQGEKVGSISLRRGDEFQQLAETINQVLEQRDQLDRSDQAEQAEQAEQGEAAEQGDPTEQKKSDETPDDKGTV